MCVCVCACVRACARVCVYVCASECVCFNANPLYYYVLRVLLYAGRWRKCDLFFDSRNSSADHVMWVDVYMYMCTERSKVKMTLCVS